MFHRTFNPGPSQISDAVKSDIVSATEQNVASISHRSSLFIEITEKAIKGLRQYFNVPNDYQVLLTTSATEALELVVRNLVVEESFHFTNGHFSELFAKVSEAFGNQAQVNAVEWGQQNKHARIAVPNNSEIVTLTYNETSTGVSCDNKTVRDLRKRLNNKLLVVDITSVAGCLPLEVDQADVWLFSVQKGLGLPSGLGVMFVSAAAMTRSKQIKHHGLFSFERMSQKMTEFQTLHTPNVLGIYLLAQQLERWNALGASSNFPQTIAKAKLLDEFIEHQPKLAYFVKDAAARSKTTFCISAKPDVIKHLHQSAKEAKLVLGAGYGKLKQETFRVANFPALTRGDIKQLIDVLDAAL